jgi:ubiquinone biosynthesis protein UbiJ
LQEESRDLVNGTELDEFLRGVDELRETADRVEVRLARLEQRLKGAA